MEEGKPARVDPFPRVEAGLLAFAAVSFTINLAHYVLQSTSVLYMGYRYGFSEAQVGFVLAGVGVMSMIIQGGLVGPFVRRFGERTAILVGYLGGVGGFALYAVAPVWWVYALGVPVMALWGLATPSVQAIVSKKVDPQHQGLLQGGLAGIVGIAGMIGPILYTQTFAWFIGPDRPSICRARRLALVLPRRRRARHRHVRDPRMSWTEPGLSAERNRDAGLELRRAHDEGRLHMRDIFRPCDLVGQEGLERRQVRRDAAQDEIVLPVSACGTRARWARPYLLLEPP